MHFGPQGVSAEKFRPQRHTFRATIAPFPAQSPLVLSMKNLRREALILYRNKKQFLEISARNFAVFPLL